MNEMENAVTLVTGAGSGLGAASAHTFAEAGSTVVCLDINGQAAECTRAGLPDSHQCHLALSCDVSDADQVQHAVRMALDRLGRIDVAINCAAIDHTYWLEELTIEQFDQVIAIDLRGPFLVAKAVWPAMKQQGGGHIVNIASTAALRAWTGASAYHAAKFGVLGMSRGLSTEGRKDNIRVTTVIPGGMRTHFFDRFESQGIPMPDEENLQDPANVAAAILCAVRMPANSNLQELVITPTNEPSWP